MKDALLQVQLLVPSLETDAKVTASLKREEELTLELESDLKVFDASSVQKLILKYGMFLQTTTVVIILILILMIIDVHNQSMLCQTL